LIKRRNKGNMSTNLNLIEKYFKERHQSTTDIGLFEFGIGGCIFDCLLFNGHKMRLRGFEFKVSRADFLTEIRTEKWKKYLSFCHTFSFVCPKGLINKNEVPKNAGLLWITTVNEHYGYTERKHDFPMGFWIKRPRFLGEIPEDEFRKIVLVLLGRVKYRKDEFF